MTDFNLTYLIPEKFHSSELMIAYLESLNTIITEWVSSIEGLADLSNPNTVPIEYIQNLANLLGNAILSEDDATEAQRREELIQTVDWIKSKGTYESIKIIGLMLNMNLEVLSMYTNDYVTFVLKDWYVAINDEDNPTGLDSSYYNSPHFGIQIRLNVKYPATATWTYDYLWEPSMFNNLDTYIEKTRPIHTVPHYYILMEPECDSTGSVTQVDGDIYTRVEGTWTVTKQYFDSGLYFDDSNYFDTSQDAFYNGITKWVLGTGNKGISPSDSGFTGDVETSALTGTVDDIRIYTDKVEWEIIVDAQTLYGISELYLYTPGSPDVLQLSCLFPDINLSTDINLRIVITVNR